jgi:opacity protein-like surface antigen
MRFASVVLVLFSLSTAASAQVAEFGVLGGYSMLKKADIGSLATVNPQPNDLQLQDGFRLGFRFTFNTWQFFGHEVGYAYNRTNWLDNTTGSQVGSSIHQGFYDFLAYATPEGKKIRPFAAGGLQFSNFVWPGYSATSGGGSTKFGYNYGGGVKVKVSPIFLIRFDVRNYASPKPFGLPAQNGWLNQLETSAGLSFTL